MTLVQSRSKSHVSGLERKLQDFRKVLEALTKPLPITPDLMAGLLNTDREIVKHAITHLLDLVTKIVAKSARVPSLKSPTSSSRSLLSPNASAAGTPVSPAKTAGNAAAPEAFPDHHPGSLNRCVTCGCRHGGGEGCAGSWWLGGAGHQRQCNCSLRDEGR
jgi:hypothetical protein